MRLSFWNERFDSLHPLGDSCLCGGFVIQFRCGQCDAKLRVPETHAGKQARCPRCKGALRIPQAPTSPSVESRGAETADAAPQNPLDPALLEPPRASETSVSEPAATCDENAPRSPFQVLLYPFSVSGVIHILVFSLLPPLWAQATTLRFWESPGIGPLFWLVLLTLYFIHYAATCLSDSAAGGTRAVDVNSEATPLSVDALLSTAQTILPAVAFVWAPAFAYYLFKERVDWILLTWLAVAGFSFPMILLAVNDFDSIRGASPLLVLPSIASVLRPYCVLASCQFALGALTGTLLYLSVGHSGIWLLRPPVFYVALVAVHVLGRFYCRHKERLNWGA